MSVRAVALKLVLFSTFVVGCSDPGTDASAGELLDTTSEAIDAVFDRRVAAAVEVKAHGRRDVWVFVCDTDKKLRRLIRIDDVGWTEDGILDHDCRGVPSIARYPGANSDAIAVYSGYGDGHLWELWFPDTGDWDNFGWTDVSAVSGFGAMTGSPVVADSGSGGEVSVALERVFDDGLYTLDWSGSWSYRKVLMSSGSITPIRTSNRVVGRRLENNGRYLAGRGLSNDDPTSGWVARRTGGWTDPYVLYRKLQGAGDIKGTPEIGPNRVYVWSADGRLRGRTIAAANDGAWWDVAPLCAIEGSPIVDPDASGDVRNIFVRPPNGRLFRVREEGEPGAAGYRRDCWASAIPDGTITSAPEWILGAQVSQSDPHARSLLYRGSNASLYSLFGGIRSNLHIDVP